MPLMRANGALLLRVLAFLRAGREASSDDATIKPRLTMPSGLAISGIGHLAFVLLAVFFAGANPFDAAPVEAVTVDIVSAEDIPGDPADGTGPVEAETETKETAMPSESLPVAGLAVQAATPLQPAPPRSNPQAARQAAATPPAALMQAPFIPLQPPQQEPPQPEEPHEANAGNMFGMPLTMPDGTLGGRFDTQAIDRADIAADAVATFRSRLKTCAALPEGLAANVRVVLRVYLKPDGTLAAGLRQNPEPIKVEGVSAGGGALFQSAVEALRKCQPYTMLPAERYQEWKTIDLTFTPQNF
jgi:hypothetical protein